MTSDTTTPSIARQRDYFSFLGVPRKLRLDAADLERRFRTLSREFHPDYFYNASVAERRSSLERSSYLNDAYRTLKQPVARIGYLLELEGFGTGPSGSKAAPTVPPSLLEEVFALNEELDAVRELRDSGAPADRWRRRLEDARQPIDEKRAEHEAELDRLSAEWDALIEKGESHGGRKQVLEALRERMLERNYITNLLSGIERELS